MNYSDYERNVRATSPESKSWLSRFFSGIGAWIKRKFIQIGCVFGLATAPVVAEATVHNLSAPVVAEVKGELVNPPPHEYVEQVFCPMTNELIYVFSPTEELPIPDGLAYEDRPADYTSEDAIHVSSTYKRLHGEVGDAYGKWLVTDDEYKYFHNEYMDNVRFRELADDVMFLPGMVCGLINLDVTLPKLGEMAQRIDARVRAWNAAGTFVPIECSMGGPGISVATYDRANSNVQPQSNTTKVIEQPKTHQPFGPDYVPGSMMEALKKEVAAEQLAKQQAGIPHIPQFQQETQYGNVPKTEQEMMEKMVMDAVPSVADLVVIDEHFDRLEAQERDARHAAGLAEQHDPFQGAPSQELERQFQSTMGNGPNHLPHGHAPEYHYDTPATPPTHAPALFTNANPYDGGGIAVQEQQYLCPSMLVGNTPIARNVTPTHYDPNAHLPIYPPGYEPPSLLGDMNTQPGHYWK